jgi:hypothetical protein
MSKFYGKFLYDSKDKSKFDSRFDSLKYLAEVVAERLVVTSPNLSGKILISYQNLEIAIGRYFNDIDHFRERHQIDLSHTSKVVAHTIKWLSLFPVLFSSAKPAEFDLLSEKEQSVLYNVNYTYICEVIEYFIDPINPNISEQKYDRIYSDVKYYLKTGSYNERMASLWFEEIIKN